MSGMDEYSRKIREQNAKELEAIQANYADVANERLQSVAQGGSPSPFASPWLAMKQQYYNLRMMPYERAVGGENAGSILASPQSGARDLKWERDIQQAQRNTGKLPKPFIP